MVKIMARLVMMVSVVIVGLIELFGAWEAVVVVQ